MEEEKNSDLYIPTNIRRRKEYADGFGKKELIITIMWLFIGVFIGFILFLIKNEIFFIIVSSFTCAAGAYAFTKKDKTNRCTIDYLKDNYKFYKSQKFYEYKYHNIYEKEVRKNVKRENNRSERNGK